MQLSFGSSLVLKAKFPNFRTENKQAYSWANWSRFRLLQKMTSVQVKFIRFRIFVYRRLQASLPIPM